MIMCKLPWYDQIKNIQKTITNINYYCNYCNRKLRSQYDIYPKNAKAAKPRNMPAAIISMDIQPPLLFPIVTS